MPTSGPGSKRTRLVRGFTLIELLVVVVLIAILSATISMAMRDPAGVQLEREADRLAALFETARAESRTAGLAVQWKLAPADNADGDQFRFLGLPDTVQLPRRWLAAPVAVEIIGANAVRLGPEPMIGAQRLVLRLGSQSLVMATDGLTPFAVAPNP